MIGDNICWNFDRRGAVVGNNSGSLICDTYQPCDSPRPYDGWCARPLLGGSFKDAVVVAMFRLARYGGWLKSHLYIIRLCRICIINSVKGDATRKPGAALKFCGSLCKSMETCSVVWYRVSMAQWVPT